MSTEREGEGTKFTIDRKLFTSDIWFASPWKLKIWLYLIGNANHTDGRFLGIDIKRGQLIRSYRTIKMDCGYRIGYRMKYPSFDTVRRVCEDLTKELRIVQRTVHCGTLFTICNYNELQPMTEKRTDQREHGLSFNDRSMTVHNKNDKNDNNVNNSIYTSDFETFWKAYPKKVGKGAAFRVWKRAKTKPAINDLLQILDQHKKSEQWNKDGGQYIPNPATWIGQNRWEDEVSAGAPHLKSRRVELLKEKYPDKIKGEQDEH